MSLRSEWLRRASRSGWPYATFALICLVNYPSWSIGLVGDDLVHRQFALDQLHSLQPRSAWWNLFDDSRRSVSTLDSHDTLFGPLPWWASPNFCFALFRPLSAASHIFDYWAWPNSPWLMHLHNTLLYAVIVLIAGDLYRRWLGTGVAFWVALLAYTIDDSHTIGTAWIASRNTLLSALFSLLTLWLLDTRARRGARWAGLLCPVALLCAHASGESSIAAWAYFLAYALFLSPRSRTQSLVALWPLAAVSAGWFTLTTALGYGVRGSGIYVDPRTDLVAFAHVALERFPAIVRLQFGVPEETLPGLARGVRSGIGAASLALAAVALAVSLPRTWHLPSTKFFLLGSLLSLVPQTTVGALARLMYLSGFGAHGVIGTVFAGSLDALSSRPVWRRFSAAIALAGLLLVHGVVALVSPAFALQFALGVHAQVERAMRSLPSGSQLQDSEIIVMNYPDYLSMVFIGLYRSQLGAPGPRKLRVLGVSPTPVRLTRTEAGALELAPVGGYLLDPSSLLVRPREEHFAAGETVPFGTGHVRIDAVTTDGRPERVSVHLRDLDDPRLRWVAWDASAQAFRQMSLPAVGQTLWLPRSTP